MTTKNKSDDVGETCMFYSEHAEQEEIDRTKYSAEIHKTIFQSRLLKTKIPDVEQQIKKKTGTEHNSKVQMKKHTKKKTYKMGTLVINESAIRYNVHNSFVLSC